MRYLSSLRDFIRAFGVRWFVLMSGSLGVPLTISTYFVTADVAKVLLGLTGISCFIFSLHWIWKVERDARLNAESKAQKLLMDRENLLINRERSFLFLDPPNYETWKAKIIFVVGGRNLRVYLKYSFFSRGLGSGCWNPPTFLPLLQISDFAQGQEITVDLIALDQPRRFWRWILEGSESTLASGLYRCQLVFIAENEPRDYFNFLICDDEPRSRLIVGENNFSYAQEWKDEDAMHHDLSTGQGTE